MKTDEDDEEEGKSPVQVRARKRAEKPKKELRSDATSGALKSAPAVKNLELLKVETRVRTRSMSKQGKDPKVKN